MKPKHPGLLIFVALCALLAFNYPWLSLFSSPTLLGGIPPLLIYLFGLWLGLILLIRHILADQPDSAEEQDPDV